MSSFKQSLNNYFEIEKKGSTIKTEIIAGLTTFMTMVYILVVNAEMFDNGLGSAVSFGGMYIVTALSAIAGTMLMALLAKIPFAQAPGMGLNAFFVFTICGASYGYTYANALVIILASGILFTALTFGGIREKIVKAVPNCVRIAIPAGIGLFIAFIGLQKSGIIVSDAFAVGNNVVISSTIVKLFKMTLVGAGAVKFATIMPMLVTLLTVFAIAALSKKKVKGSMLLGIVGGTILYYILGAIFGTLDKIVMENPFKAFKEFGTQSFGILFREGFKGLFTDFSSVLTFIAVFISFAMVDMFDTIGTLIGTATRANMLDETGEIPNMKKALLCDSIATMVGAVCGTSTVTTFVESSAGVAEGGRTGLTALVVAILFFIAMFLSPIARLIPSCATAAALIYVGVLMMGGVKNVNWDDAADAVPAFLTIIMMAFTYNISYGIGFGFISYVFIKVFTGKFKDISIITLILAIIFLGNFLLVTH